MKVIDGNSYIRRSDSISVVVNRVDVDGYVWFMIDGVEVCLYEDVFTAAYR